MANNFSFNIDLMKKDSNLIKIENENFQEYLNNMSEISKSISDIIGNESNKLRNEWVALSDSLSRMSKLYNSTINEMINGMNTTVLSSEQIERNMLKSMDTNVVSSIDDANKEMMDLFS